MKEHGPIRYLIYYNPQAEPGLMITRQFVETGKLTASPEEVMDTLRRRFLDRPSIMRRAIQSTYLSDEINAINKLIDILSQPSSEATDVPLSVAKTYESRFYILNLPKSSTMYLRWHDAQISNIQMRAENDSTRCNLKFPRKS